MPRAARCRPSTPRVLAVASLLAAGVIAGAPGCTTVGPDAGPDAGPATPAALPDGITASVLQSRTDVVDGRLVVQLDNGTGAALTFASFEVAAPGLEPGLHFEGPRTIPDDTSVQYRMDLTPARCEGDAGPAEVTISAELESDDGDRDGDGPAGIAVGTIVADDPYDTLPRLQNSGCLTAAVERVATFTLADRLRSTGSGVDRQAWLDLAIEPTGAASGSLELEQVLGTTLLTAEAGLTWSTTAAHVEASDAPSAISLPVRPARCDPHAGAEDKRGTILPLVVTTSEGWSGQVEVRASPSLKADLFAYFTERCGLTTTPVE